MGENITWQPLGSTKNELMHTLHALMLTGGMSKGMRGKKVNWIERGDPGMEEGIEIWVTNVMKEMKSDK